MKQLVVETEEAMRALGARLATSLAAGDTVLLEGELGAGKTTLARGIVGALGFDSAVRSPTYNLIQLFPTQPLVMHADLYRVSSAAGLGLEDYLESHLCLIEWPDRLAGVVDPDRCWRVQIAFEGMGRRVTISSPFSEADQTNLR